MKPSIYHRLQNLQSKILNKLFLLPFYKLYTIIHWDLEVLFVWEVTIHHLFQTLARQAVRTSKPNHFPFKPSPQILWDTLSDNGLVTFSSSTHNKVVSKLPLHHNLPPINYCYLCTTSILKYISYHGVPALDVHLSH